MQGPIATVPLIDAYYKQCYTHILYCGATTPDKNFLNTWKISYMTIYNTADAVSCTKAASEMGYNVDGVMHVSDKMLLLSGMKIHTHGKNKIWVPQETPDMSEMCKDKHSANCLVLTKTVINDLSAKLDTLKTKSVNKLKLKGCLKKLLPPAKRESYFVKDVVFYVPKRHAKLFQEIADLQLGLHSYVAVLLLQCLDTQPLYLNSARQLTGDQHVDFLFPFLFSAVDTGKAAKGQYCKTIHSC